MRRGFTLIEMLVAMAITLIMMGAVMSLFGTVGNSISGSRAAMEISERLRNARNVLQRDLGNLTVTVWPPRRPESNEGYFEYVEGAYHDRTFYSTTTPPPDGNGTPGDTDDIVAATVTSPTESFVARVPQIDSGGTLRTVTIESHSAEIIWFVRGRTLYRRILPIIGSFDYNLSVAGIQPFPSNIGYYATSDVSTRLGTPGTDGPMFLNTLGDLTKRENRFGHVPGTGSGGFPFPTSVWGWLRMPLLEECSTSTWPAGRSPNDTETPQSKAFSSARLFSLADPTPSYNPLTNPVPYSGTEVMRETGALLDFANGNRAGEDVILTNVVGFDIKAYDSSVVVRLVTTGSSNIALLPSDPGYDAATTVAGSGGYVDLNYARYLTSTFTPSQFSGVGDQPGLPRVYDTWSLHYENNGIDEDGDGVADGGSNGLDDDTDGVVDDPDEFDAPPPYSYPLRGIQIKIRVYEPDSRQVREVTVVQDFMPQ